MSYLSRYTVSIRSSSKALSFKAGSVEQAASVGVRDLLREGVTAIVRTHNGEEHFVVVKGCSYNDYFLESEDQGENVEETQ
jgi:hypothetical protein